MSYRYEHVEIVRVIDGDTVEIHIDMGFNIVLKHQRVRIYGIDTPEVRHRDPNHKALGKIASSAAEHWFELHRNVALVSYEWSATDSLGRILGDFASLITPVVFLSDYLRSRGLAVPYKTPWTDELIKEGLSRNELT